MDNVFVSGYIATIQSRFNEQELRMIRDSLCAYSSSWDITPLKAEITEYDYQLPVEYKYFMVSKRQDGKMSDRSAGVYEAVLKSMLYSIKLPVSQIKTPHIRGYLYATDKNQNTGGELSPYTKNLKKSIIRSFFSWCLSNGYIDKNPASVLVNERTDGVKQREPYSDEEVEKLRFGCADARDKAIVEMLLATGVRATEFVNIKRSDINMSEKSITVLGKGNKLRTVFFNASAKIALLRYWETLPMITEYAFVIDRKPYTQIKRMSLNAVVRKIGKRGGVENVIVHRFRHTFATRLESRGCPLEVIRDLLGHSEIGTTTRYAHVSKEKTKAEYNRYTA